MNRTRLCPVPPSFLLFWAHRLSLFLMHFLVQTKDFLPSTTALSLLTRRWVTNAES